MESFSDKFVDCLILTLHFTRNGIHFDSFTGFLRVTNIDFFAYQTTRFTYVADFDSINRFYYYATGKLLTSLHKN